MPSNAKHTQQAETKIDGDASDLNIPLLIEDFLAAVEKSFTYRRKAKAGEAIKVGLDLGTASIVLVVLGAKNRPLGAARRFCQVVRDGLLLDFSLARTICEELKNELEKKIGVELKFAAMAVPPGTSERDAASHRFVASAAGLEAEQIFEEPNAANNLLKIQNGAIVDIGGGTTGVSILKDGQVLHSFDEATGGTHLTLVLAGHHKISFEEAEIYKQDPQNAKKIAALVSPVLQKIGTIIKNGISDYPISEIHLVGGTASTVGIEKIIAQETGIKTTASARPILVTPVGIALGCRAFVPESLI